MIATMASDGQATSTGHDPAPHLDPESRLWLRRLSATGPERDAALADLHRLFVRVAHAEANRRRPSLPDAVVADLDDLCLQAADDALVAVIAKLDTFAGRSRFTAWAIKFVLLETSVRLRRHAWRGRPVELDDDAWSRLADTTATSGQRQVEQLELLEDLQRAIGAALTERQREVFVGAAVQEIPIDVLAERLGSNRNAVYKTLHDARRKLRAALADAGHEVLA